MSQETHAGQAGSASGSRCCASRQASAPVEAVEWTLAGQSGRGLGGGRVLDRAVVGASTRTAVPRHSPVLRVAVPAGRAHDGSTSTTSWIFENSVPGPARARAGQGGPGARSSTCVATAPSRWTRPTSTRRARVAGRARTGSTLSKAPRSSRCLERSVNEGRPWRHRRRRAGLLAGFNTPSRRLEFWSQTMAVPGDWPEQASCRTTSRATSIRKHGSTASKFGVRAGADVPACRP